MSAGEKSIKRALEAVGENGRKKKGRICLTRQILMCARHGQVLTGESPECRSISAKHIAKGKGVPREVESEGSRRQTSGLTDRNHIRHDRMGKAASKAEARKLIRNPMVCMWQIDGRKEPVLTRGGLMDA